jgi:hypothetical protein
MEPPHGPPEKAAQERGSAALNPNHSRAIGAWAGQGAPPPPLPPHIKRGPLLYFLLSP